MTKVRWAALSATSFDCIDGSKPSSAEQ